MVASASALPGAIDVKAARARRSLVRSSSNRSRIHRRLARPRGR